MPRGSFFDARHGGRWIGAVCTRAGGFGADDGWSWSGGEVRIEPVRAGAIATHGSVVAMSDAGQAFDDSFGAFPEVNTFEDGIYQIGDGTVVGVLGIGMMQTVLVRSEENFPVLQLCDKRSVFLTGAVGEFVHVVRVYADYNEQRELPRKPTQQGTDAERRCSDEHEQLGTLPPAELREVAREVVMDDVGLDHRLPDDGRVLRKVGVLRPVDQASDEVHRHGNEYDLSGEAEDRE